VPGEHRRGAGFSQGRRRPRRNRIHLDIAAADPETEIARLVAPGPAHSRAGDGYTMLRDSEGDPFCVAQA
jgi:hypothetical protein